MKNLYAPLIPSIGAKLGLAFIILLLRLDASASYIAGEITVTHLQGIRYTITQKIYTDCTGVPPGNTAAVRIIGGPAFLTTTLTQTSITDRSIACSGQDSSCIKEYTYSTTVNLSSNLTYIFTSDLASRNTAITTLNNPASQNMFLATTFKTVAGNSSPAFANRPVSVFCAGHLSTFSAGGNDADGDSLVYSLVNALGTAGNPVNYTSGFSGTQPLSSSSPITINPNTGLFSFTPSVINEVAVLCVRVEEYRNGVKVGAVNRDIQIKNIDCSAILPPVINCPGNIQTPVNASGCKATVNYTVSTSDNCTPVTLVQTAGLPSGSDFPLGVTINSFVATDAQGTATTCTFTVTVTSDLSVNAGVDEQTFYGYTADQSVTHTAIVTGGVPGYSYSWSLSRPLICNLVNSAGDESFSGGSCVNNNCPPSGSPTIAPVCSGSATVTATLAQDADVCVRVTDSKGCVATDCFHIYSEDARCFSGNSKVVICHSTGSLSNPWVQICVAQASVQAHFAQNPGDYVGRCLPPSFKTDEEEMVNPESLSDIKAYPNPFSDKLNIEFTLPQDSKVKLELLSVTGQLLNVLEGDVKAGELQKAEFNAGGISRGMVIYRLQSEQKAYYGRVVMMN
jgi:hypothetical protein